MKDFEGSGSGLIKVLARRFLERQRNRGRFEFRISRIYGVTATLTSSIFSVMVEVLKRCDPTSKRPHLLHNKRLKAPEKGKNWNLIAVLTKKKERDRRTEV
jgi:hypothetical protein